MLWFVFLMSSARTEALIYKKKKKNSLTWLSRSAPLLTCVSVSHTWMELTMLMRSKSWAILKGSLNFSQRSRGLFTTDQSSIPDRLKKYWSQKDRAQECHWPINNTKCVLFFAPSKNWTNLETGTHRELKEKNYLKHKDDWVMGKKVRVGEGDMLK